MTGLSLEPLGPHGPVYGPAGAAAGLPAIVILHGSEGPMAGWAHRFAAILAAHGMLALPLSFGEGDFWSAGPIREVDLAVIPAAGAALGAHRRAGGVGLLGWSRGAEASLLVAALAGPDTPFGAVAAHAPPDRVLAAFDPGAMRAGRPFLDPDPAHGRAWRWAGREAALAPGTALPVERAPMPLFLSAGTVDEVWPAAAMVQALAARRAAAGGTVETMIAEGQGHGFDFATEPQLWARLAAFFRRHLDAA